MLEKQIYICSYCGEEFYDREKCKSHEKGCKMFVSTYKGEANINYEGYRENFIGEISIHDLWERLEGCIIEIKILKR